MSRARASQLRKDVSARLTLESGLIAGRLARYLSTSLADSNEPIAEGVAFLLGCYDSISQGKPITSWSSDPLTRVDEADPHPLDRLAQRFLFSSIEIQLLLLAGLCEEHEGLAAVLRSLHPRGEPRATVGLAVQLLAGDEIDRNSFRRLLETGALCRSGAVKMSDDGPFFERSLIIADSLWSALHGIDAWPLSITRVVGPAVLAGLDEWFASDNARLAIHAIHKRETCTVVITADNEQMAFDRGIALTCRADAQFVGLALPSTSGSGWAKLAGLHAVVRDVVPVLKLMPAESGVAKDVYGFYDFPGVCVASNALVGSCVQPDRRLIEVPAERLSFTARQKMWATLTPRLGAHATTLATRYAVEPANATAVASDLEFVASLEEREPKLSDVMASIRARSTVPVSAGVKLLRPHATWSDIVLADDRLQQLREAVSRLERQAQVFDEWGFLKGRTGARGVRLLFSGPPGTGKTLAAEVIAHALDVDLLVVDLSRVVSKWIGETEKNLASVFEAAESGQAALFFDEADALFGKRTEVTDAHDRYANLETAYLLTRLEQFEGLAILATNLRQNIDAAFLRRLEFVVDFEEPDREERAALWKCHIPNRGLLAPDVNLFEFASLYPVVGGVIRNAAVAAGFLAAADGGAIEREHLVHAIRREYAKAGRSFPGVPLGLTVS